MPASIIVWSSLSSQFLPVACLTESVTGRLEIFLNCLNPMITIPFSDSISWLHQLPGATLTRLILEDYLWTLLLPRGCIAGFHIFIFDLSLSIIVKWQGLMSGQNILFDCCWTNRNGVRPWDERKHVDHCWYWMESATPLSRLWTEGLLPFVYHKAWWKLLN